MMYLRTFPPDNGGTARSLRELGWAAYLVGLDRETKDAWQEAYEIRRDLDDRQGILDSIFTLSLLALTKSDWQTARTLAEQEMDIASDINNLFYPRWTSPRAGDRGEHGNCGAP